MSKDFKVRDFRSKDFFIVDNVYLNGYAKILGVHATAVYLSLCRHADSVSQTSFPSQKLIGEENNMGERTVRRKIEILEQWNIIRVKREKDTEGKWLNNVYYLLDKSEWKVKPEATVAGGSLGTKPEATDDNQRPLWPHNNTHNIYNKGNGKKTDFQNYILTLKEDPEFSGKNIALELKKFKDYLLAKGKRYKDYRAGFRNWLRNSDKYGPQRKQEVKGDNERMLEKLNATRN